MLFNVLIETEMFIWESSVRACFKTSVNIILLKNTVKKRNVIFIDVRNVLCALLVSQIQHGLLCLKELKVVNDINACYWNSDKCIKSDCGDIDNFLLWVRVYYQTSDNVLRSFLYIQGFSVFRHELKERACLE